jgi:hypothetical protein
VNLADTKNACGLAMTGVGTVDCAHHNLKQLCAVGDLQKGEWYVTLSNDNNQADNLGRYVNMHGLPSLLDVATHL